MGLHDCLTAYNDTDSHAMGRPETYPDSHKRALNNVTYVARHHTPKMPVDHRDVAHGLRRPWDRPAQHLNELGPAGYNFYRVTQLDEQRIWHVDQLAQSKRSPSLRDKEAIQLLRAGEKRLKGPFTSPPPPSTDTFFTVYKGAKFSRRPMSAGGDRHLPAPSAQQSPRPSMLQLMESPTIFSEKVLRKAGI